MLCPAMWEGTRRLRERVVTWILPGPDAIAAAIAIGVGLLAGAANLGFRALIEGADWLFFGVLGGWLHIRPGEPDGNVLLLPLLPLAGMGLLTVLNRLFPKAELCEASLDEYLERVNIRGGYLPRRWIFSKTVATALTVGSGMSAGLEAPIVQIGGSIGSLVARIVGTSSARLRTLIACGSAAGLSATFGAPITGVLFAQEIILLGEYQLRAFGLIVLSSASAMVFNHWMESTHEVLEVGQYAWAYELDLLLFAVLGLLLGTVSVAFMRTYYRLEDWLHAQVPRGWRLLFGGGAVGLLLIFFPWVSGNGYETLNAIQRAPHWPAWLLLLIAAVKIVATSLTLGSGGSGGKFVPALFIGGTVGAGFALLVNELFPGAVEQPGAFMLVGMGAMLGASFHAPLTSIFFLLELTGDYGAVLPSMFATVAAVALARAIDRENILTYGLARRGIHLHQGREHAVLESLHVSAFYTTDFQPVPAKMPLEDFLHYLTNSRFNYFPVVDDDGNLVGVVSSQDVREVLFERDVWPLLVVGDIATTKNLKTVTPRTTLAEALELFGQKELDQLIVVDERDPKKVLGMLGRQAILDAYHKAILRREIAEEESA